LHTFRRYVDPIVFASVTSALVLVALAACLILAGRAIATPPLEVLRSQQRIVEQRSEPRWARIPLKEPLTNRGRDGFTERVAAGGRTG